MSERDVTVSSSGGQRAASGRWIGWRWPWAAAGFVLLTALFYLVAAHVTVSDSDGATVVLQGHAMAGGNVLLDRWRLSFDSFWSVDAVAYAVIGLFTGIRGVILYLVPAAIASAIVVCGVIMARQDHRDFGGVAGAVTVVALLGFPSYVFSLFFLRGPLHVATTLWCLLAFLCLRRARFGPGWIVAVALLAAGLLGDLLAAPLGVIPVALAGLASMGRTRDWREGLPLAAAAAAAAGLAAATRAVIVTIGAFSIAGGHPRATTPQMVHNLRLVVTWGAHMLGVGSGSLASGGVPPFLWALHIVSWLAVAIATLAASWQLVRGVWNGVQRRTPASHPVRLWQTTNDLLLFGVLGSVVVFITLTVDLDPGYDRYLTPAAIFGSILTGRLVAQIASKLKTEHIRRIAAAAGILVTALYASELTFELAAPQPARPYVALGNFLNAHDLDDGLGDYWSASIVTATTNGAVRIRPVTTDTHGRLTPYDRQSDTSWYRNPHFRFVTYNTAEPWGDVNRSTAVATFGPPKHTYTVGTYRVLVWTHPVHLRPVPT